MRLLETSNSAVFVDRDAKMLFALGTGYPSYAPGGGYKHFVASDPGVWKQ